MLKFQCFLKLPVLALITLWLAYALLGWYLSAHHIIWLVGASIISVALAVAWKSNPLLERFTSLGSQGLFVVITVSLIVSLSVVLAITWTNSFTLIVIPFAAMILAQIEMVFSGFDKLATFLFLMFVATTGLVFGEVVDLNIFPSNKS
ncbi:MAG: hypothetical protein N4J56_003350 [Chroococcidiopsis sp. SAG 2025]|uniref:hypothetical protein n=1 Tax=Chroococcidiopsis sp. SAG 2025 TaxID=171389 RepID=UPI002936F665|nr:hypothetical protein [Chroococcidiopsis sp. SAG 2025]MDV2993696.1 hypothetical protein [Chroococcidiopsis sp. SAG 2025]